MTYKEQILSLRAAGKTYSQIKEELGCSKGTISYYLGEGQVDKSRKRQRRLRNTIRDYIFTVKQTLSVPTVAKIIRTG